MPDDEPPDGAVVDAGFTVGATVGVVTDDGPVVDTAGAPLPVPGVPEDGEAADEHELSIRVAAIPNAIANPFTRVMCMYLPRWIV